jgi:hypothetical protein
MIGCFRIFYRRVYNALHIFFDKLSMKVRPKNSKYRDVNDDEIENILSENIMFG